MAKELVTDELWEIVEPLLPEEPPQTPWRQTPLRRPGDSHGHRLRLEERHPLGTAPPEEMGCGSGLTCSGGA
jgi:transposase